MTKHWMDAPDPNAKRRPSFEQLLAEYAAEHDVPLFKVTRVSSSSNSRKAGLTRADVAEVRRLWTTEHHLTAYDIAKRFDSNPSAIYNAVKGLPRPPKWSSRWGAA